MMRTRISVSCKEPTMDPLSREMKLYNSVYHYECRSCGASLDLVPPASIGFGMTVGVIVLAFWAFILFHGSSSPGVWALIVYFIACCGLAAVWLPEALKYRLYPVVLSGLSVDDFHAHGSNNYAAKMITLIEKLGFLAGLMAPIAIILGVLGLAALIGYVNFTFFE
jgi:hypothetical protein